MGGLLIHRLLQAFVHELMKMDTHLVRGVVRDRELVAFFTPAVIQRGNGDPVDLVVLFIVRRVPAPVLPVFLQPRADHVREGFPALYGQVDGQLPQDRKDLLGGFVAPQVVVAEINVDKAGLPVPDQGIDRRIRDIVQRNPGNDDQIGDLRDHIGHGQQFKVPDHLLADEEGDDGQAFREKQQPEYLPGYLVFSRKAVHDNRYDQDVIEDHQDLENSMHPSVFLVKDWKAVHDFQLRVPVKIPCLHGVHDIDKHHRADREAQRLQEPPCLPRPDVAQRADGQQHDQLQEAAAHVNDPVRSQRLGQHGGMRQHHVSEADDRHQHEHQRNMRVIMLMPFEQIDPRQQQGNHQENIVIQHDRIDAAHVPPPSGFSAVGYTGYVILCQIRRRDKCLPRRGGCPFIVHNKFTIHALNPSLLLCIIFALGKALHSEIRRIIS